MCESSQAIEILAERNNNLCNAVIFKTHTIDECGNFIRSRNLNIPKRRMLPTRFDFCHQGILYARSVFDSGVRFDTRFRLISDKILNDKIISIDSPIYDLQLAAFVFGGRSSAKWAVRKELVKYICLYLVRRL